MQLITNEYRKLNENLHNKNLSYGTSGHKCSDRIMHLAAQLLTTEILDYGCGKCTLSHTLPFSIKNYDPAIRAFADEPEPATLVVCTDVMEHIEPDLLDHVLAHIEAKTKHVAYFIISTTAAMKSLEDGRNAHLIVMDGEKWLDKLREYFDIGSYQTHPQAIEIIATRKGMTLPPPPEPKGNT